MRRGIKTAWVVAGLAVLGAMIAGGREARAKGIVISTGVTQPVGDPFYEYVFDVQLLAGSTLDNGGFITVYDLPEIDQNSLTQQPSSKWGSSLQKVGVTPSGASPVDSSSLWNVTWEWNGAALTAPTNSNLDLGLFKVGPTAQPETPTLTYVGSLDGTTASNQGTITVSAVPEPSSVALLVLGIGSVSLIALRKARRRPMPAA